MTNNQKAEMLRIIGRHKARTLTNLEEVNAPQVYVDSVRSGFDWMRNDLVEMAAEISRR